MRIKILLVGAALAALVGGGTASATLQNELDVNVLQHKAGAPATVKIHAVNIDSTPGDVKSAGQKIPERIAQVVLTSKTTKYNAKAVPQCSSKIAPITQPAARISPPCPGKTKIGTGKATILAGLAGWPTPAVGGTDFISAKLNFYNYSTKIAHANMAILIEAISDQPIPDAYTYMLATIKGHTLTANIPSPASIPQNLAQFYNGKNFSVINFDAQIKSPRVKKHKRPLISLKAGNINAQLKVVRE